MLLRFIKREYLTVDLVLDVCLVASLLFFIVSLVLLATVA